MAALHSGASKEGNAHSRLVQLSKFAFVERLASSQTRDGVLRTTAEVMCGCGAAARTSDQAWRSGAANANGYAEQRCVRARCSGWYCVMECVQARVGQRLFDCAIGVGVRTPERLGNTRHVLCYIGCPL